MTDGPLMVSSWVLNHSLMLVIKSPPSPNEKISFLVWVYCSPLLFGVPRALQADSSVSSPFQCAELSSPGYAHLIMPFSGEVAGVTGATTMSPCLVAGLFNQDEAGKVTGLVFEWLITNEMEFC